MLLGEHEKLQHQKVQLSLSLSDTLFISHTHTRLSKTIKIGDKNIRLYNLNTILQ